MKHKEATTKRLFLFAGYNKSGIIDDALIFYVKKLSEFGDIVLFMDSDCADSEIKKIKKYCLHTCATRHGEYDFGSYKRAYIWATKNTNLADYNFIYLVNDSVYGPLYDLSRYFDAMENMGHDGFGIVKNPHHNHPHIQSWFIGLKQSIFLTSWFDKFMHSITKQQSKGLITKLYEHGLSRQISTHKLTWDCLYCVRGRGIYNQVKKLYKSGMPFMKKVAFTRNHGALGAQIRYVLNSTSMDAQKSILSAAQHANGIQYTNWLLTKNPIRILIRQIHHIAYKLFIEGI